LKLSSFLRSCSPLAMLAWICCCAVSMARCSSPRRAASGLELGLLGLALQRAQLLARAGQLALGLDHASSSSAWRSWVSASCMSSSSKRASPVARRS
jgi:hypothetical protein